MSLKVRSTVVPLSLVLCASVGCGGSIAAAALTGDASALDVASPDVGTDEAAATDAAIEATIEATGDTGSDSEASADAGVVPCSGPPHLAPVGADFHPMNAVDCPIQHVAIYGDQIACNGVSVTIGGLPVSVVSYVPMGFLMDAGGITIAMPDGGFIIPAGDGGPPTLLVPVQVRNAFGQDTAGDLLRVHPGAGHDGGC